MENFDYYEKFVNEFTEIRNILNQNNIGAVSLTAMNLPVDWKAHLSV